jgi:hypothetical protein
MERLLRLPPEQHKAVTRPDSAQAHAQRQRRLKEREKTLEQQSDENLP